MKKGIKALALFGVSLVTAGFIGAALVTAGHKADLAKADPKVYTLTLNDETTLPDDATHMRVFTENHNCIYLKHQNGADRSGKLIEFHNNASYLENADLITGMKSITVTFSGTVADSTYVTMSYGYRDSANYLRYSDPVDLASGVAYDFDGLQPSVFRLGCRGAEVSTNHITIVSAVIEYYCAGDQDAAIRESVASALLNASPVKAGTTLTYGNYPQSLADATPEYSTDPFMGYDESWETRKLSNGYYLWGNQVVARVQAQSTGYDDEYTIGEYYWFKVEPVTWKTVDIGNIGGAKLVYIWVTDKILDTSIFDTDGNAPTDYADTTMIGEKMNSFSAAALPNNGSPYVVRGQSITCSTGDGTVPTGVYPWTKNTSQGKSPSNNAIAQFYASSQAVGTDYARSRAYAGNFDASKHMDSWARKNSSDASGTYYYVNTSGSVATDQVYSVSLGIRPSMRTTGI